MADHYKVQRNALRNHAVHVEAEVSKWRAAGEAMKGAEVESIAFTRAGGQIAAAYSKIVHDFAWTAWKVGGTFEGCALVLQGTVKNYGKADAIISDDIANRREWQF
ncbi:hypothetical protein [Actinomadura sp. NTSP31]|uniref:hypothetical protein n=1 Tax=Actinomadura sp. NTSP31 TaxID=1735447 RepID=UPI0035BFF8EA